MSAPDHAIPEPDGRPDGGDGGDGADGADGAPAPQGTELLVITGLSGAGRSTTAHVLEDLGWYVVDNLPPQMLTPLAQLAAQAGGAVPGQVGEGRAGRGCSR